MKSFSAATDINVSELDLDNLDQYFVQKNRWNPKRLDGLQLPDGTTVTVQAYKEDLPDEMKKFWDNHYAIFKLENKELGYTAFLSIHRLTKISSLTKVLDGQRRATGGTRIIDSYANDNKVQVDSTELSYEMSKKNAMQFLKIGGSKGAIWLQNGIVANTRSAEFDAKTMKEARDNVLISYAKAYENYRAPYWRGCFNRPRCKYFRGRCKINVGTCPYVYSSLC